MKWATIRHLRFCTAMKTGLLMAVAALAFESPAQTGPTVPLHDDSDWWSIARALDSDMTIKTQERELSGLNFRIAGVPLSDGVFKAAAARLGRASIVERGDAAAGRSQACYVSDATPGKVHLIFEQGEVSLSFYLFSSSRPWTGNNLCVHSDLISPKLSTESGLHLGLTPSEVVSILGKPSIGRQNELLYFLHATKKASAEELAKLRKQNAQVSDEEFHKNYDFFDLSVTVHAKFVDSKLAFLMVSKTEVY